MLSAEIIESNWKRLLGFVERGFSGERQETLLKLYNEQEQRIATAPASGKIHFHSAYLGGYVVHVLNVMRIIPEVSELWQKLGGKKEYTDEEMFFVALNHDLGKIGDLKNDYYVASNNDWKRKNYGEMFEVNYKDFMKVQMRSIYLLQHYGVKMTQREFLTILLHDGLYDEGNKPYFINYNPHKLDRFVYLIHFADMWATSLEYESWAETKEAKEFLDKA